MGALFVLVLHADLARLFFGLILTAGAVPQYARRPSGATSSSLRSSRVTQDEVVSLWFDLSRPTLAGPA
jgi:hypothetical protein